jgi:hypothetical protein
MTQNEPKRRLGSRKSAGFGGGSEGFQSKPRRRKSGGQETGRSAWTARSARTALMDYLQWPSCQYQPLLWCIQRPSTHAAFACGRRSHWPEPQT